MQLQRIRFKVTDVYKFLGLFVISIAARYFLPLSLGNLVFWIFLLLFMASKHERNHFWLVFFWLLFTSPGYLFYERGLFKLPSVSLPALDRDIIYAEIFTMIAIGKAIINPLKQNVFYNKKLYLIIAYAVFLMLYGFILGTTLISSLKAVRYFLPLLLLLFIPRLLPYGQILNAIKLMFICVFILVFMQLFDIVTGHPLATILGETQLMFSGREVDEYFSTFDVNLGVVRIVYGPAILLISMSISCVLLLVRRNIFKKYYLSFIIFLSAFSIFMSATRGWIIATALILSAYTLLDFKKFYKILLIGLALITVTVSVPQLNIQIINAYDRVMTIESVLRGDLTAGGTLARITERSPLVMNKFYESPLFGFGFSDEFYKFQDGHVGNQNLLLNGGVVGFGLYFFFLTFFILSYYKIYKSTREKTMLIFIAILLGLIIIHSMTRMIFSYSLAVDTAIAIGIFFFFSDYFSKKSCNMEES